MPGLVLANPMKKYMIETVDLFNVDIVRTAMVRLLLCLIMTKSCSLIYGQM